VLSGAFAVHRKALKKSECEDAGAEACTAEQASLVHRGAPEKSECEEAGQGLKERCVP